MTESEWLDRALLRSPLPIAVVEAEARVVRLANPALGALLRRAPEALVGEPVAKVLGDERVLHDLLERVARTGTADCAPISGGTAVVWPGSDATALIVQLVPVPGAPEPAPSTTTQDVEDIRAANEKLVLFAVENAALLQRERAAREEAARSAEELREVNRKKDEFLAMLGHELRNPLAPVVHALHLLRRRDREPAAVDKLLGVIDRQVQQMTRLIDDLLEVARITSGKVRILREVVDLHDVVSRAVETARPLIEARRHELTLSFPAAPALVVGDRDRLAQVVANLLNNAAKYTDEGGKIHITIEHAGESDVRLRVRDTGVGVPKEMLSKIFDMFTQLDRSSDRSQGGLGLGLTLVRSLVELQGGTIEARSDGPGKGAEFVVRLPAAAPPAGVAHDDGATAPGPRRRVLVVDDNVDAAEMLRDALEEAGHEARTVHDGLEALDVARELEPEVILLDLGLPRMDGFEVARRLHADPSKRYTLVALTGYGQESDRRRTAAAGFDHHLVKPVDMRTLDALLRSPLKSA